MARCRPLAPRLSPMTPCDRANLPSAAAEAIAAAQQAVAEGHALVAAMKRHYRIVGCNKRKQADSPQVGGGTVGDACRAAMTKTAISLSEFG